MRIGLPAILGLGYFVSELILACTRHSKEKTASKDASSLQVLWLVIFGQTVYHLL